MFFSRINFLASAFNGAIASTARTAALGVSAGTILGMANDRDDKKDGVEKTLKAVAKMSLMGMLL